MEKHLDLKWQKMFVVFTILSSTTTITYYKYAFSHLLYDLFDDKLAERCTLRRDVGLICSEKRTLTKKTRKTYA